jgi:HAMP domain-containing protein
MKGSAPQNYNNRPKRNLRSLLIEPFKQIKLGLYVMIVTVIFSGIAGYFYREAFDEQYAHVMEIFGVVDEATKDEVVVNDIFKKNRIKLVIVFVAYVLVMFWVIFRSTHKYYGPLVSIDRFIRHMTDGQYHQRVTIRRGDELGKLAQSLNEMAAALEKKYGAPGGKRASDVQPKDPTKT